MVKLTDNEKQILDDIKKNNKRFKFQQENPKKVGAYDRYENYKSATNYDQFIQLGGKNEDLRNDLQKGYIIIDNIDDILSDSNSEQSLITEIVDVEESVDGDSIEEIETEEDILKDIMKDLINKVEEPIDTKQVLNNYNKDNKLIEKYFGDKTIKKKYNMIDLFAGTGAFSTAFKKKNINCCFANDFCKNSKIIFDMNHDIELTYGDLNIIENKNIPPHYILCGGFPCQPFSIAGKQQGFEDERSNVFWKILSIIKYHNPEIVILENVKNLKSHDEGNTFKVIYKKLTELGYHIKYEILNTCKLTEVPQNRERIYIVCFKDKNKYDKFEFNFEEKEKEQIKELLTKEDIPEKYYYTDRFKVYECVKQGVTKSIDENVLYQYRRYYVRENKNNVCPTLTANMGSGGHNVPLLKDKKGIRSLTPKECFNLQGFPADFKLPELCDSALYKLAGNAVSVPVVELIAEKISKLIH